MPLVEKSIPTKKPGVYRTEQVYEPPKLRSWAELTEECPVPPDIAAAIGTGRPGLIQDIRRPLTTEEGQQLINLIRVLLDTNNELQQHCVRVAQRAEQLQDNLKGVVTSVNKLQALAEFRNPEEDDEE